MWHFCNHGGYVSIRLGGHGGIEIAVRRDEVLWEEERERGMRWLSIWNCKLKKVLSYMEYQDAEPYWPFTAIMSQPIQHKTVPYPYQQLSGWRAHGMVPVTCMHGYSAQPYMALLSRGTEKKTNKQKKTEWLVLDSV